MEREIKRVKNGGPDTRGHGTTGMAKLWKQELGDLLRQAPRL
jgi:homoserine O-acetyltransferase